MPDTSQSSWSTQGALYSHVTESESRPPRPTHAGEVLETIPSHMPNRVIVRNELQSFHKLQILRIK